ncbi:DUF4843 domain-containing protein [Chitinophaga rhizosphaerae]|uniref:DUF4843 domain-containing protein n=1 Tax=Chitinophaga rhizosphaerae TaxID=1864947 RepID=UPI0013DF72B2|nr:DUF4843 domain-containing protein [Chitinophaga rhizosphaerae]
MKQIFTMAMFATLLAACKKDQYYLYNDIARIQFGPAPNRIYQTSFDLADTVKPYTFYYEPAGTSQDTVFFDIYAIGGVSDKDRPFALEQIMLEEATNAEPGVHYKPFSDPSLKDAYVIRAGEVHTSVPIVLLRDASLKDESVKLQITVKPNESFQPGEKTKLWRRVDFSDRLSQPGLWNATATQYYWGKYSMTKHAFMIEKTGEKWNDEFLALVNTDYAMISFWRLKLKTLLTDYNNAHPGEPLTDESGEPVIFP